MADNFFELYLEELGTVPPLDGAEKAVVLKETALQNAEARGRLVEGSLRQVLELVREYGDRELPLTDLVQEANTALMLAAVEYDGSQDWEELLKRRVTEAVELALEEQKTQLEIEENVAARVNVLQTVSQVMAKELGREATLEELAAKMKMEPEEVKDIMKLTLDAFTVSGEGQVMSSGEEDESEGANPIKHGWSLEDER